MIQVSVVIVNWNGEKLLKQCLDQLIKINKLNLEIIVVDNGSNDASCQMISNDYSQVILIQNSQNEYYTKANNQGIAIAKGKYILLLNNDVELYSECLENLVDKMESCEKIGITAPRFIDKQGNTIPSCMRFPKLKTVLFYYTALGHLFPDNKAIKSYYLKDWNQEDTRYVDQPAGACLLIRHSIIDQIGLLDENMLLFFSDVDLCKRIKDYNYEILYLAEAKAFHQVGASTKKLPEMLELYHKDRITYYRKYYGFIGQFLCKLSVIDMAIGEIVKAYRNVKFSQDLIIFLKRIFKTVENIMFY